MAALHNALKTLGPADFSTISTDNLKDFLSNAFANGQLLVDSVPISPPSEAPLAAIGRSRSNTTSSIASSASEISISNARSIPPVPEVEALQKEWNPVKLNPRDNPLGMSVYKLAGKDGKGAWFARRSVHEGLGFTKWKKGLEREFPETMKVQGAPGEGNIRGIGGERRVEYSHFEGVGKVEVYHLSAQFPGPTTPRDFVTLLLTSDQALTDRSDGKHEVPRHFMVISRPCLHPDAPPRDGFIRGQYESIEFIREIPMKRGPRRSVSTSNLLLVPGTQTLVKSGSNLGKEAILRNANLSASLNENALPSRETHESSRSQSETRARGKTISFDRPRGFDAVGQGLDVSSEGDESESNPVEWIMITRSDPGGSVPRFMIERGTPGAIVADAFKFLNWTCATDMEDFESDNENSDGDSRSDERRLSHDHERGLYNYQTNGHMVGVEEELEAEGHSAPSEPTTINGGGTNGQLLAEEPKDKDPSIERAGSERRDSTSSTSSCSSVGSFASALETIDGIQNDGSSIRTSDSVTQSKVTSLQEKELQRLEEKKRKLDEKLGKARDKDMSKKSEDSAKEEEALRKAEERHEKEVKKQEEKYKKEVEKLERKKAKDEQKAEEKRRKVAEKDERVKLLRELEEVKAEVTVLRKERELLRSAMGELQAENTALAVKVGRLGMQGAEVLKEVREEAGRAGRLRASSLKGLTRPTSIKRSGSTALSFSTSDKESQKENLAVTNSSSS